MGSITVLHNEISSFVEERAGFSVYVEIDSVKILFDTSMKDDIIQNAQKTSIDLLEVDYVIFSHGHYDHTDGLKNLNLSGIAHILAHPDCFQKKFATHKGKEIYIGCPLHLEYLQRETDVILTKEPYWVLPDRMVFLGEIPRQNDFEAKKPIGYNVDHQSDYVLDDSALVIKTRDGLIIISGCSHAGICNIVEYSKQVCHDDRVYMVMGGFHLFEDHLIAPTVEYFQSQHCELLYPAHCLSDKAFAAMIEIGGKRIHTLETFNFI